MLPMSVTEMIMTPMTLIWRARSGMSILNTDVSTRKERDSILMIIPSQLRENFSLVLLFMSISKMKIAFYQSLQRGT
uniref:Uncharacterized protein n=1 Tax=Manihot esculenta TaxID=3983 RepID=A0A2C9UYP4_MANES